MIEWQRFEVKMRLYICFEECLSMFRKHQRKSTYPHGVVEIVHSKVPVENISFGIEIASVLIGTFSRFVVVGFLQGFDLFRRDEV